MGLNLLITRLSILPAHPVLLAAAYVLGAFGITHAHVATLARPLLVALAVTAVVLMLVATVTRDRRVGALLTTATLAALIGLGPLLLIVGWWMVARRFAPGFRLPHLPGLGTITQALNVVTLVWLAIAIVTAAPQLVRSPTVLTPAVAIDEDAAESRPDIYVLLLDGYARGDTLAEVGYDNRPFLDELHERGFDVYPGATGSYEFTVQVLASMLHGRHIADLPVAAPSSTVDQHRVLMSLIADAPELDELRDIGYEIVTSKSHASHVTVWTADRILDDGGFTDFEYRLLHDTELDRIVTAVAPTFLWDSYRDRVTSQFHHLEQLAAEDAAQPRFALVHAISPHPPYTFHADGSPAPPIACFPIECEAGFVPEDALSRGEMASRYIAQVEHVNRLTLSALDAILQDPEVVIIVMSDHGMRLDRADRAEWYRTLFASRTPGHPNAFAAAPHPTALFATLANAYFGAHADLPALTRYAMIDDNRLRVRPIAGSEESAP